MSAWCPHCRKIVQPMDALDVLVTEYEAAERAVADAEVAVWSCAAGDDMPEETMQAILAEEKAKRRMERVQRKIDAAMQAPQS